MSHEDEFNTEEHFRILSDAERSKMLMDVHKCLIGDPLQNKPGLASKVESHNKILFGTPEWDGLIRDNQRLKSDFSKYSNMIRGIMAVGGLALTVIGIWVVWKSK